MVLVSAPTLFALLAAVLSTSAPSVPVVGPVPDGLREARQLDPFYAKHVAVAGFPILGSARVSDAALREAAWIVRRMLAGRDDVLEALTANGVHLTVMAYDEYTTDVPEHADLAPRIYWDRRARGLGGSPVSCAEENLLGFPGDPYATENILIHEFAHIVHAQGVGALDPTFDRRLEAAYDAARGGGRWTGTYAATNREEYWAEGTQSWFDDNRQDDALHNHVDTRAELRAYDPGLAALCEEVFGDGAWRYELPLARAPADRAHLADVDFAALPRFEWRDEPVPARPRVSIQTARGNVELELEHAAAPTAVEALVRAVHEGAYSDGTLTRRNGDEAVSVVPAGGRPGGEARLVGASVRIGEDEVGTVVEGAELLRGLLGEAKPLPIQRAIRTNR